MMLRIAGFAFLTSLAAASAAQDKLQDRPPIIDVHVHAYEKDKRWTLRAPNPRTGRPLTATSERAQSAWRSKASNPPRS